eukprot:TCALIF_09888-PA protein Name:"Protein of unknown function" AED:0.06 eAED:0.06 QI:189/1/0.5/1/1/0.5/2/0/46
MVVDSDKTTNHLAKNEANVGKRTSHILCPPFQVKGGAAKSPGIANG